MSNKHVAIALLFLFACLVAVPSVRANDPPNSRTVTVEGFGSTFEDARRDAIRNAINQVVGTLVDAETRVTQDTVIEQILTASNAYIENHRILGNRQEDGLWYVSMEATVESRALQMRLAGSPTTVRQVDGAAILGRIETQADALHISENEPILLLAKVLRDQNYPYSIMEATAELGKEPVRREGNNLVMPLYITVRANAQKFEEFRKAIEPVLEKIAILRGTMNLRAQQQGSGDRAYLFVDGPRQTMTASANTVFVYLNTTYNNALTGTGWNRYELSNKASPLFAAYSGIVPAVEISFHAKDESVIATERIGACVERGAMVLLSNYTNVFQAFSVHNTFFGHYSNYDGADCRHRNSPHFLPPVVSLYAIGWWQHKAYCCGCSQMAPHTVATDVMTTHVENRHCLEDV